MTDITNDNLYLILPGKISLLALRYAREFGISIIEALRRVYSSRTYQELSREETKLWHLGPVALYDYFIENK